MTPSDPFTTRGALANGMTPAQLRSHRWRAPYAGVRLPKAELSHAADCAALLEVVRTPAGMSASSAALLYGWWSTPELRNRPTDITVPPGAVVSRAGVRARRSQLAASDVRYRGGIALTSPTRTLADLAADLSLVDLVVLIDAATHMRHCTMDELESAASLSGIRGVRNLRRALRYAEPLSESPMETLLRLMFMLPGLPRPIAQAEVFDHSGLFVARVDLKPPGVSAAFEYDGAHHRTPSGHTRDVVRWRALRACGHDVFPYTASDLFGRPQEIIADYQRVLGLPSDPRAVQRWLREFDRSSFSRWRITE
jgi:hypothetical protein